MNMSLKMLFMSLLKSEKREALKKELNVRK